MVRLIFTVSANNGVSHVSLSSDVDSSTTSRDLQDAWIGAKQMNVEQSAKALITQICKEKDINPATVLV
jgi:hypothetical protein